MALTKKVEHSVIPIKDFSSCAFCFVRRLCLPVSVDKEEINLIDELVTGRPQLKKSDYLFHSGDKFQSLYALKSGAIKTYGSTRDGREQITGFHFAGELIGLDAIGNNMHNCNAVALEKTVVCELPYKNIENISLQVPSIQQEITRLMSLEIHNDEEMLMAIGSMRAEQRVACFLFSLYRRLMLTNKEKSMFRLPMTREEIGNYLGLSLETVSRRMSSLHEEGVIEVENRLIKLKNIDRLQILCR
ncbi:fumarate and nitrate reduction regulatory protein [bacterium BMS3Bbin11]|nr:fumarate and nitrate reduction regulatory protein [bacterium BMS3Abin11]GBE46080.1 fumarate and nitrate reduction regulatory protein [bacterium BMS3Bbin11]HDH08020.1 fumarate/nitrate reduction transcriptional regulator Fnr [Gammaproteobacteria bacterium]HDH16068.1 fumarate/nitrate reduction transcriptional regulator Fnr [Gammaproteobacteria bacterium]HDZ78002.1 fumarate/nitrate reduction transcriptional regulator Fnr [Gammaproteobacteria bacterium]